MGGDMFSWLRSAAKPAQAPKTAARPEPEPEPGSAELEAKRRALGVEDAIKAIPGVTAPMLVALGESGIKTLEELAGCAVDDLHGWIEPMGDTSTTHAGVLAGFGLSREECGAMIIRARVKAGWIDEAAAQPTKQSS
jgi:transcription termination/antitermination protein NusA